MTPTTPPSAGTGRCQASPGQASLPTEPVRRCPSPCLPPGEPEREIHSGGSHPCNRAGRAALASPEQGRGPGRRDWSARELLASRTASCLQLPPPYPRPRPEKPNLRQARAEVTSRRTALGRATGAPPTRTGGGGARVAEPQRAGPLGPAGIWSGVSPQEPHPFPPPRPTPRSPEPSVSPFPLPVSSFLQSRSLSRPSLPSSYPHLSNLLFHPPPLSSPPRSRLPHPWEAPPVGQRRLKSGFPSRGRQRLVGGSSAGAGAASRTERPRPERAGHRPHRPPARPPALRTAAALRVSARDPPPPHPARLCRLLQRASLPSGRRCRCRRRHRAKFRPRPPSAVQGSSASAPGPRLPASPGPGTMSEKSVEAAAELSAKDLKEKKDKVEEKAGRKERKKEVVEEEENGAEEEEEETAEDGEDDDEGDEEDEEEEEEEDEGPVRKRTAEEEDEADPKRQKTENGASA
ncbi:parathymosin [Apodemus sylvaticus]|nr:parathymosin [Apodemus sylvaticus]